MTTIIPDSFPRDWSKAKSDAYFVWREDEGIPVGMHWREQHPARPTSIYEAWCIEWVTQRLLGKHNEPIGVQK